MSTLIEHAKRELAEAGLLDPNGDCYGDMAGKAVLELMETFAAQGHSGGSADIVLTIFNRLARYKLLNPLPNPTKTREYIDHSDSHGGNPVWQSTRLSSVFSDDGGKTWYDIDKRVPWWKRILGVRRVYLTFAVKE